jgi:hypothetical protein
LNVIALENPRRDKRSRIWNVEPCAIRQLLHFGSSEQTSNSIVCTTSSGRPRAIDAHPSSPTRRTFLREFMLNFCAVRD